MCFDDFVMEGACMQVVVIGSCTVILLPLCPASLTYKSPQRFKIIHGIHPIGCKEQSIDLKIFW